MRKPSERLKDSITKDNLWIYILKMLSEKNYYPYRLREEIEKRFGFSPGSVTSYIVLKKLEAQGFVKKWKEKSLFGPERNFYKITSKGRRELNNGIKILRNLIKKIE
ncbi:MAG: PadR family transcriptional regulator [Candidatus Aenigmatarchaeota archaeon]